MAGLAGGKSELSLEQWFARNGKAVAPGEPAASYATLCDRALTATLPQVIQTQLPKTRKHETKTAFLNRAEQCRKLYSWPTASSEKATDRFTARQVPL